MQEFSSSSQLVFSYSLHARQVQSEVVLERLAGDARVLLATGLVVLDSARLAAQRPVLEVWMASHGMRVAVLDEPTGLRILGVQMGVSFAAMRSQFAAMLTRAEEVAGGKVFAEQQRLLSAPWLLAAQLARGVIAGYRETPPRDELVQVLAAVARLREQREVVAGWELVPGQDLLPSSVVAAVGARDASLLDLFLDAASAL